VQLVAVALNMEPKKFASPSARNSCTRKETGMGCAFMCDICMLPQRQTWPQPILRRCSHAVPADNTATKTQSRQQA
jgi:hypothetical protein